MPTLWTAISAGQFHSLGITSAGVAYAWGNNSNNQLENVNNGAEKILTPTLICLQF